MKADERKGTTQSERFHKVDTASDFGKHLWISDVPDQQRRLRDFVAHLRSWLYEVEQMGVPKFGETGFRLRGFREALADHFESCRHQHTEGLGREFEDQAKQLLSRLDDLIRKLEMSDPPFSSWQELIRSLTEFTDDLEELEGRLVSRDA